MNDFLGYKLAIKEVVLATGHCFSNSVTIQRDCQGNGPVCHFTN